MDIKEVSFINEKQIKSPNIIKAIKKPYFYYYIFYLFILILISLYLFLGDSKKTDINDFEKLQTDLKRQKENREFVYLTKLILEIYQNTKSNNLKVDYIKIENSKILLTLESQEKKGVYSLLEQFSKSSLDDMQYDESLKRYKSNVSFKIFRK